MTYALQRQAVTIITKNLIDYTLARFIGDGEDEFNSLAPKIRKTIEKRIKAFCAVDELISQNVKLLKACNRVATSMQIGLSPRSFYHLYRLWSEGGRKPSARGKQTGPWFKPRDWHMLIPGWNNGKSSQPKEFVAYVNLLYAETSRSDSVAGVHQQLLDNWRAGMEIPGYGTLNEWCIRHNRAAPTGPILRKTDYPSGWSVDTIRRMLPKAQVKRALVQRGEFHAHSHWGDQLLRDRSKLRPLELVTFDDVRFDIKVRMMVDGKPQVVYPLGLFALDVATGTIISHGVKGAAKRGHETERGKKAGTRMAIDSQDTRFLLLKIIETCGLPVGYKMRLLLENAAADLNKHDKQAFTGLLADHIEIENTGMIRAKLLKSGFLDDGGMPWFKGWIEAWFRLLHCRLNGLPGTTGNRYNNDPGDLDDKVKYTLRTINRAIEAGISIELLDLPILSLEEFREILDDYVRRINLRISHNLQGFDRVYEYEYAPGRYIRDDHRDAGQIIPVGANLIERCEAPLERLTRLARNQQFYRPAPSTLVPLYLNKHKVTVRNCRIEVKDKKLSTDSIIFRDAEHAGLLESLEKQTVWAFLPDDCSQVHITDLEYSYIASIENVCRINVANKAEILEMSGAVHRGRQETRNEVAAILGPKEDRYRRMRETNASLLGDNIETAKQKSTSRKTKKARVAAFNSDDLYDSFTPDSEPDREEYPQFDPNLLI